MIFPRLCFLEYISIQHYCLVLVITEWFNSQMLWFDLELWQWTLFCMSLSQSKVMQALRSPCLSLLLSEEKALLLAALSALEAVKALLYSIKFEVDYCQFWTKIMKESERKKRMKLDGEKEIGIEFSRALRHWSLVQSTKLLPRQLLTEVTSLE